MALGCRRDPKNYVHAANYPSHLKTNLLLKLKGIKLGFYVKKEYGNEHVVLFGQLADIIDHDHQCFPHGMCTLVSSGAKKRAIDSI